MPLEYALATGCRFRVSKLAHLALVACEHEQLRLLRMCMADGSVQAHKKQTWQQESSEIGMTA